MQTIGCPCYRPFNRQTLPRAQNLKSYLRALDLDDGRVRKHFFNAVDLPLTAAWADLARLLPCLRRFDVRVPERPGAALARPGVVNLAFATFGIEENAIAVVVFEQAFTRTDSANVAGLEIVSGQAHCFGQGRYFLVVHPHIARCAGAAIAALGTLKSQSVLEPRASRHVVSRW
jgi:hypothetical protein